MIKPKIIIACFSILLPLSACTQNPSMSFKQDLDTLSHHYNPIVLTDGDSKVAVLAELQGRVMSSTAKGDDAQSIGWFNRKAIRKTHLHKSNEVLGGASRLWLGPEVGPLGVFIPPSDPVDSEYIHVPAAISTQPYEVVSRSASQAVFKQRSSVLNRNRVTLTFDIERSITMLTASDIEKMLSVSLDESVDRVAYSTKSTMINRSEHDWQYETGVLSLWDLSAFAAGDKHIAIIPTRKPLAEVTPYFSETKRSHTRIKGNAVFYLADAHYMNKVGVPPEYALPFMGSYDPERKLLTVIQFNFPQTFAGRYVNYVWNQPDQPFDGDVVQIFNDGDYFGPFFELESSSPAKPLKRGEGQSHFHNVYHFIGEPESLNPIAKAVLGVTIQDIKQAFVD